MFEQLGQRSEMDIFCLYSAWNVLVDEGIF